MIHFCTSNDGILNPNSIFAAQKCCSTSKQLHTGHDTCQLKRLSHPSQSHNNQSHGQRFGRTDSQPQAGFHCYALPFFLSTSMVTPWVATIFLQPPPAECDSRIESLWLVPQRSISRFKCQFSLERSLWSFFNQVSTTRQPRCTLRQSAISLTLQNLIS